VKRASLLAGILLLALCVGCAGEGKFLSQRGTAGARSLNENWNVRGHIRKGSFSDIHYLYDENWKLKGYIRWNQFSDRYELYDRDWKRKGYLKDLGVFPGKE
jgi:hypothetical protein